MGLSRLVLFIILLAPVMDHFASPPLSLPRAERSSVDRKLVDTQWRLASFGTTGSEAPVVTGTTITLRFGSDRRAGGSGGCNSYSSEYCEKGEQLSFSQIMSTKRACLDQKGNQQEQLYFAALEAASRFKLSDDSLKIFYDDGRSVLNFVKDSPPKTQE